MTTVSRKFHNTYHFAPLEGVNRNGWTSAQDFREGQFEGTRFDHGVYLSSESSSASNNTVRGADSEIFHGRIICKLTTHSPLVVGGSQKKPMKADDKEDKKKKEDTNDCTFVEPFMRDGCPAIPASSLRGMISNLAEVASQSAMRVLHDQKPLSYREAAAPDTVLSAIGRLEFENGRWLLRPLTAPNMTLREKGRLEFTGKLINGKSKHNLWSMVFEEYINFRGFIEHCNVPKTRGATETYAAFEGCSLSKLPKHRNDSHLRWARSILVGQSVKTKKANGVPGYLRVMYHRNRKDQMPNRKYDLFIPCPDDVTKNDPLEISDNALETFLSLANERAEAENKSELAPEMWLPFVPLSSEDELKKERHGEDHLLKLTSGQLVYFDVEPDNDGRPEVSRISFSAIWRQPVLDKSIPGEEHLASVYDFFADKEFLPFSSDRTSVSPAEWLFGFVQEDRAGNAVPSEDRGRTRRRTRSAYAGRVRFADALPADIDGRQFFVDGDLAKPDEADGTRYILLREQSAPKLPSPQFYFRKEAPLTGAIRKSELVSNKNHPKHRPQGWKMYMHHSLDVAEDDPNAPWRTRIMEGDSRKRKMAVRPVKKGTEFWFHVDFDNLGRKEIELLCFALAPRYSASGETQDEFLHKLGLGKSLGLGSVKIEPVAFFQIDRHKRYSDPDLFSSPRYHEVHVGSEALVQQIPSDRYMTEKAHLARTDVLGAESKAPGRFSEEYGAWLSQAAPNTHSALRTLGRPTHSDPVHPPVSIGQKPWEEEETFRWFSANATRFKAKALPSQAQFLTPLVRHEVGEAAKLPVLFPSCPAPNPRNLHFFIWMDDVESREILKVLEKELRGDRFIQIDKWDEEQKGTYIKKIENIIGRSDKAVAVLINFRDHEYDWLQGVENLTDEAKRRRVSRRERILDLESDELGFDDGTSLLTKVRQLISR